MTIGHYINPWTEILVDQGAEGAKSGLQYTLELNFGELEFDWENRAIQARVYGVGEAPPLLSVRWEMDWQNRTNGSSSWHCINHRGTVNPVHRFVTQVISVGIMLTFAGAPTALVVLALAFLFRRFRISRC